jgi:hypothetical protein
MKNHGTLPAEAGRPCDCCGRVHRKLFELDGFWMGKTCRDDYRIYKHNKDITSAHWFGWEKKYRKVEIMVKGKPATV